MRCFLGAWIGLACFWACGGSSDPYNLDLMSERDKAVVHYCVLRELCDYDPQGLGLGYCVSRESRVGTVEDRTTRTLAWSPVRDCIEKAESCEELEACRTPPAEHASKCASNPIADICDGSWLLYCKYDEVWGVDCAETGLECHQTEYGAVCRRGSCEPGMEPACEEDMIVTCDEGSEFADDCLPDLGRICSEEDGEPDCIGAGDACEQEYAGFCEGSVKNVCVSGRLARYDCPALHPDLTCKENTGLASCAPERSDCEMDMDERCEDGVITYCHLGRPATLDCARFGASGCETQSLAHDIARCVP